MRPTTATTRYEALAQFRNWLRVAPPGTSQCYHEGFLAEDRFAPIYGADETVHHFTPVEPFHSLASAVLEAATRDRYILLSQRRVAEGHFLYMATRTAVAFKKGLTDAS